MNPNEIISKNKNLLFTKQLLTIITEKPELLDNDLIKLETEMFPDFSLEEFTDCVRALNKRRVIDFESDEDIYSLSGGGDNFIWVNVEKEKLNKYIQLANDDFLGIDLKNSKKIIDILSAINSLISSNLKKNKEIKIYNLKKIDKEVLEWIADFTGLVGIGYELSADFDTDELGRSVAVGAGEFPETIKRIDIDNLKKLYEKLKKGLVEPTAKQIKLINFKNTIEWRCVKCSRFLDKLTNKEQIENYLVDFIIKKYKICHKCRKRNYFEVNKNGKIVFLMLSENNKKI